MGASSVPASVSTANCLRSLATSLQAVEIESISSTSPGNAIHFYIFFVGKKNKKTKGTVLSLQSFLSDGDQPPLGVTQVAKNLRNLDGEDSDDGGNVLTVVCQLPTAPRASRVYDHTNVPHKPPFIAYVNNLPFDTTDDDVYDFFNNTNIISVRLPREDGESGRLRGYGYIEFETRDDLIQALSLPDPSIKGRRIRIELSNDSDHKHGPRRNYETHNDEDNTDWRRQKPRNDLNDRGFDLKPQNSSGVGSSWRSQNYTNSKSSSNTHFHSENRNNIIAERPRLNLKPRTLPLPEKDISLNNSESKVDDKKTAEKIFGSAKPVDTTARDLEIEKRLSEIRKMDTKQSVSDVLTKNVEKMNLENTVKNEPMETNWRNRRINDEPREEKKVVDPDDVGDDSVIDNAIMIKYHQ
ncbi:eukaryotic translation initiation factor 4B-like [Musca vetustissima]|uniref:eukaryotic translation initiation factor 4B-like n=1 Tax=Musca vetustissima TaxID=27455 RepID=UPI002AB66D8F|nr:eukaryotic translation initiation factor 4B-like [Musca vetustissima]